MASATVLVGRESARNNDCASNVCRVKRGEGPVGRCRWGGAEPAGAEQPSRRIITGTETIFRRPFSAAGLHAAPAPTPLWP